MLGPSGPTPFGLGTFTMEATAHEQVEEWLKRYASPQRSSRARSERTALSVVVEFSTNASPTIVRNRSWTFVGWR